MRLAMAFGLAVLAALVGPAPAAAQGTGVCDVLVNGGDVERHAEVERALVVDVNEPTTVVFSGTSRTRAPVEVWVEFAGVRWPVPIRTVESPGRGGSWQTSGVPVADYAWAGVGLYRVVATGGGCDPVEGWVKIVGRSPFTTAAGATATVVLLIGLVLQVTGLVRGARGKGGLVLSTLGGVPAGLGAIVLAQQAGVVPITEGWAVTWLVAPGFVGGVANRLLAPRGAPGGADAAPGREFPETAAPTPEPATAAPRAEPVTAAEPTTDTVGSAGAPAAGAPAAGAPERDPPRSAYALLTCPGVVVAGSAFDLLVGLSETPTPGVPGGPMVRPASSVGPYTLSVQVVADGFSLLDASGRWRRELRVTADAPYPSIALRLRAEPQPQPIATRGIRAIFSVDRQTIGMAVRSVAIAASPELARTALELPPEGGVDIEVPAQPAAPDLTVRIVHGVSESDGRLLWTFETRDPAIDLPDGPVGGDIGEHPGAFARQLIDQIAGHEGQPGLYQYVMGIANTVTDEVPQEFWDVLRAVAARNGGRPPTILFLSEEPFVPWELAVVDPPLDPALPPFLSAQACVGRWVLARRRPKLPPPTEVNVHRAVVVSGVYGQEWRLVEAEQEAAELSASLGASAVDARLEPLLACLEGDPLAEVLHVAVHGIYNPGGTKEGLILVDGRALDPILVKGARIAGAPFVFLNACQVGTGSKILGNYAGMAEALLYAGAAGVVAPLWSVDDAVAREVAVRFYRRVIDEGSSPAEVFRQERARFTADADASSTYLAYQFFGNPAMTLSWSRGS
ncbi:MAG: CHAT domain-containing protein [Actinomycetota bacterium]